MYNEVFFRGFRAKKSHINNNVQCFKETCKERGKGRKWTMKEYLYLYFLS